MPKQKSRKSINKRFKVTKTGKVLRRGSFTSHLMSGKSKRRKRRQKILVTVPEGYAKKFRKIIV